MIFKRNNKMLIIAVSVPCMFSMIGCMNIDNNRSSETFTSYSGTDTVSVSTPSDTVDTDLQESETETVKPVETFGYADYIDETVPCKNIELSDQDIEALRDYDLLYYGSYYIGFGNPYLLSSLRDYFSDDTLNVQDVGCIHDTYSEDIYDSVFEETNNVFDFDYVRYVLEENGLRLWTDEIPYDFFVEKFPDYVQEVSKGGAVDLSIRLSDRYKHNFVNEDYLNSTNREMIRLTSFLSLLNYNNHRDLLGKSFPKSKGGPIPQGLSIDGKFVWVPTEKQYNAFQKDYVGKIPGCENIDILVPETREDLMASGIDVEKYDQMCKELFGGAKMSRSRQG